MNLVMVVPTRSRPQSIKPLWSDWVKHTSESELLFVIDGDDPARDDYMRVFGEIGAAFNVGPRLRLAGTLNEVSGNLARNLPGVPIGFMGDDHRTRTHGWDDRFAEVLRETGVAYGNDLLQGERMCTAVVMTSDIISTLGYMVPPGFTHLCLDLVWRDWGQGIERLHYFDDVIIEHLHPAAGKAELDEQYLEVNDQAMVAADGAAYYDYRDNRLPADLEKLRSLL